MKEFAVYTLARLAVFAATYAVIIGLHMLITGTSTVPVLWPLVLAAVVSTAASVYLLRGMRDRFTARVQERAHRMSERFEEMRAKEDVD